MTGPFRRVGYAAFSSAEPALAAAGMEGVSSCLAEWLVLLEPTVFAAVEVWRAFCCGSALYRAQLQALVCGSYSGGQSGLGVSGSGAL